MFEVVELLSQISAQLLRRLSPLVKSQQLTITEFLILWKINKRGPYRITDLAREVGVPASTLTGVFDRLESLHYLERIHDSKDRRSILIQATPHVKEMIEAVVQNAEQELAKIFGPVPPDFMARFTQDLIEVKNHLSPKECDKQNEQN